MEIRQMLVDPSKYSIKCPFSMTPEYITIHNTANDASANNEISYMINNNYETSYHFAVDNKEVVQGLPLDRNGWHAGDGNGTGNRKSIGIEICYSQSGGDRYTQAEENCVQLVAQLLKERGWGIDRIRKHQDWSGKYCPHRILSEGRWESFKARVQEAMGGTPTPTPTPTPSSCTGDITYKVYDNAKGQWLPAVVNDSDYAGNQGHAIGGIKAKCKNGNIYLQAHITGSGWLSPVTMNSSNFDGNGANDYSGIKGKNIDCVKIWSDYGHVDYRVSPVGGNYYAWVNSATKSGTESYAGVFGKSIDKIQMK